MKESLEPYMSRKFLLAVAGGILAFVAFKSGLSHEQTMVVLSPFLSYMGAEGIADVVDRAKGNNSVSTTTKTITKDFPTISATKSPTYEQRI